MLTGICLVLYQSLSKDKPIHATNKKIINPAIFTSSNNIPRIPLQHLIISDVLHQRVKIILNFWLQFRHVIGTFRKLQGVLATRESAFYGIRTAF